MDGFQLQTYHRYGRQNRKLGLNAMCMPLCRRKCTLLCEPSLGPDYCIWRFQARIRFLESEAKYKLQVVQAWFQACILLSYMLSNLCAGSEETVEKPFKH